MTPKKKVSEAKHAFQSFRKFFGLSKTQKIDFLKKILNSVICLNIGFGFHSGPGDPGTIRPLKTIHLT